MGVVYLEYSGLLFRVHTELPSMFHIGPTWKAAFVLNPKHHSTVMVLPPIDINTTLNKETHNIMSSLLSNLPMKNYHKKSILCAICEHNNALKEKMAVKICFIIYYIRQTTS